MKNHLNNYLRISISLSILIIFVYLLFRNVNFIEVKNNFLSVNWLFLVISVMFGILVFLIKIFRWQKILTYKKNIPFKNLLEVLSISQFTSAVIPFRAGDMFQIFYLSTKENISKTVVLSSVMLYQLIDIFFIVVIFIFVSFYIIIPKTIMEKIWVFLFLIFLIIILWIVFHRKIISFICNKSSYVSNKVILINEAIKNFFSLKLFFKIIFITIIMWLCSYLQVYLFLKGFGIELSIIGILSFIVVPSFVTAIPSTPGFWGIWDFVALNVLSIFDVRKDLGLSVVLSMHFLATCVTVLFGGFFMLESWVLKKVK